MTARDYEHRRLMLGMVIDGMEPVEAAHLLTNALLALTGDGALGAQIVARERLAQHVAREIPLCPERR